MGSLHLLVETLNYFLKFDYPLTIYELWFWQHQSSFSKKFVASNYSSLKSQFPKFDSLHTLRKKREALSLDKFNFALNISQNLSNISTIEAIFITGALSMNNSPKDDDIDLMLITKPHTLWLTRFLVIVKLNKSRRPVSLKEHSSPKVANKICDNLYLDSSYLNVRPKCLMPNAHCLYVSHEILQAKCIFDRSNISQRFLLENSWVENYLPIAYKESLNIQNAHVVIPAEAGIQYLLKKLILPSLNLLSFFVQHLYMYPKITNERISLHQAFFHPRKYT